MKYYSAQTLMMFLIVVMSVTVSAQANRDEWLTLPIKIPYTLIETAIIDIEHLEEEHAILPKGALQQLHYPVDTPDMEIIHLDTDIINKRYIDKLIQPIALIDTDSVSLAWLDTHQATLEDYQTIIWVVKANRESDLSSINILLPKLTVVALSAHLFVEQFGITGYPVLLLPVNNDVTE